MNGIKNLLAYLCIGCTLSLLPFGAAADAEDFPAHFIRIIVPFAPGASTDLLARMAADAASKKLGKPVVVENRPGASTVIAARYVKSVDADGYTILLQTPGFVNNLHLLKSPGYALSDFTPVTTLGQTSFVLMTPSSLPVNNLKEFLDYARSKNGALNYGTTGHGLRPQLLAEYLKVAGGFDWSEIAYKGGMEGLQGLYSNQVQGFFSTVLVAQAQMSSPDARLIAISSDERSEFLPDVPTFKEEGLPSVTDSIWYALFVRADTPGPVLEKLRDAFREAVKTPEMHDALKKLSLSSFEKEPAQFQVELTRLSEKYEAEREKFKIEQQ